MFNTKFLTLVFILLISSILSFAQNRRDSVYIFYQDKELVENRLLSPTFSNGDHLINYGFLQLDFQKEKGAFRRAQEAYTINMPKFLATGFNVIGKFRIAGTFEFNKSFEDSLANGQKNNLEDFTTFYPYANKSGYYKRQNYIFKTSLSYSAFKNHLSPYLNLDYHKHESYGTVDPRLASNRFIYKVKPGIVYHSKKQSFGIYGILGKADEQVSLNYKNENYKSSLLYPDRIHYMQYGYGSSRIKDTSSVYKYDNYKGAGIEYALNSKTWNMQFSTAYQLFENKNYNKSKTTSGVTTIGIFNLNTITASLLISKKNKNKSDQLISVNFAHNDGFDGNLKTSGSLNRVNYRVNSNRINGSYHYLWDKQNSTTKELGFTFIYDQNDKQDLGQANALSYEQMQIGLTGNLYHKLNPQNTLRFSIAPYYILPLRTTLKYNPNSLTEFIKNVVFTDYYYFNSKAFGSQFEIELITSKIVKNQQFGIYAKMDAVQQLKQQLRADLNPTFIPNSNRNIFHFGINMYL